MKTLLLAFSVCLSATFAQAWCNSGCGSCDCHDPVKQYWYNPGPEITGNYARPYLYSADTGGTYADPAFYSAQRTLANWRGRHGRAAWTPEPPAPAKRARVRAGETLDK